MMRRLLAITLAALLPPAAFAAGPEAGGLERAYTKELTFLKAEKAEIERRISALDGDAKGRIAQASGQIAQMEAKLSSLRKSNAEMEDKLRASAEARPPGADDFVQANDAIQRAREALREARRRPPPVGDLSRMTPDQVEAPILAIFEQLTAEIQASGQTTVGPGKFFLANGKQVDGQLIHVGRVAVFGASAQGSGALVMSSGNLKLLPDDASAAADALAAGQIPGSLPIFLRDAAAQDGAGLTAGQGQEEAKGGIIHTLMSLPIFEAEWVLWLLIALSLISVAVMVERFVFYRRHAIDVEVVRAQLETHLGRGDFEGAAKYLATFDSLETNIILFGLREHQRGPDSVEDLVRGAETREKARYSRFLVFLATIGNNAPFIGLFGTVLGIIRAFQDLSATMANAGGSVMAGISEALIATAVGLLVAIPAVIAFNTFSSKVKKVVGNGELLARILLSSLKADEPMKKAS